MNNGQDALLFEPLEASEDQVPLLGPIVVLIVHVVSLLQAKAQDQRLGEDAVDESSDDDDEDRGDQEHLLELVLVVDDHGVGYGSPQSAEEDDGLPSQVNWLTSKAVEDVDDKEDDESPGDEDCRQSKKTEDVVGGQVSEMIRHFKAQHEVEDGLEDYSKAVDDVVGVDLIPGGHVLEGVPLLSEAVGDQADDPGEAKHVGEGEGEGGHYHDGGVVIGPPVVEAGDHPDKIPHQHPSQWRRDERARDEGVGLQWNFRDDDLRISQPIESFEEDEGDTWQV